MADAAAMDVDPPAAAESTGKGKTKDDGKGEKKRFEVKKVRVPRYPLPCLRNVYLIWIMSVVERRLPVGLGYATSFISTSGSTHRRFTRYRRRELRDLQEPHHGSLYVPQYYLCRVLSPSAYL